MSSRARVTLLLAMVAAVSTPRIAHGQADGAAASARERRAALGTSIDSMVVIVNRLLALRNTLDSEAAAKTPELGTDTAVIGPFLYVNRAPMGFPHADALEAAWNARRSMAGSAVRHLEGIVVSAHLMPRDLMHDGVAPDVISFYAPARAFGRDYAGAAEGVVSAALFARLPADVKEWLGQAGFGSRGALEWAYRDLAMSATVPARGCYDGDIPACRHALMDGISPVVSTATRASLLQHALELGGDGSYARLLDPAPDVESRLARAANRPLNDLLVSWRDAVQEARPNVHAGVMRAGFWTVAWMVGLALLAMRSTRWRLG